MTDQIVHNEANLEISSTHWAGFTELPHEVSEIRIQTTMNLLYSGIPDTIVVGETTFQSTYHVDEKTKHISPILDSLEEVREWRQQYKEL